MSQHAEFVQKILDVYKNNPDLVGSVQSLMEACGVLNANYATFSQALRYASDEGYGFLFRDKVPGMNMYKYKLRPEVNLEDWANNNGPIKARRRVKEAMTFANSGDDKGTAEEAVEVTSTSESEPEGSYGPKSSMTVQVSPVSPKIKRGWDKTIQQQADLYEGLLKELIAAGVISKDRAVRITALRANAAREVLEKLREEFDVS